MKHHQTPDAERCEHMNFTHRCNKKAVFIVSGVELEMKKYCEGHLTVNLLAGYPDEDTFTLTFR